jgi:HEAT repeat protein
MSRAAAPRQTDRLAPPATRERANVRALASSLAVIPLSVVPLFIVPLCIACLALPPSQVFAQVSGATLTPIQREIETQRARLSSAEVEERRDAVTRLGAMARPDASRAVMPALADRAPIVRATAARAVLSMPREEAARLLLPLLRDKDEFVRRETAYALGIARSPTAVDDLIAALARDKEAGVRGAAAVALGQIGDARAVPALSEALGRRVNASGVLNRATFRKSEENDFVRRAAAVSLGQLKSRDAVPALVAALSNERAGDDVRRESARALGLIGDPSAAPALRAALTARDPYLSQIAYESLRRIDPNNTIRQVQSPTK